MKGFLKENVTYFSNYIKKLLNFNLLFYHPTTQNKNESNIIFSILQKLRMTAALTLQRSVVIFSKNKLSCRTALAYMLVFTVIILSIEPRLPSRNE